MAKTLAQIRAQIEKLESQAERLRSKEVQDVVTRIKEAIGHYGLTAADLFDGRPGRKPGRPAGSGRGAGATAGGGGGGRRAAAAGGAAKKRTVAIKYRDKDGNEWSGRGSTPRWLQAAISGGAKKEDFLVG